MRLIEARHRRHAMPIISVPCSRGTKCGGALSGRRRASVTSTSRKLGIFGGSDFGVVAPRYFCRNLSPHGPTWLKWALFLNPYSNFCFFTVWIPETASFFRKQQSFYKSIQAFSKNTCMDSESWARIQKSKPIFPKHHSFPEEHRTRAAIHATNNEPLAFWHSCSSSRSRKVCAAKTEGRNAGDRH